MPEPSKPAYQSLTEHIENWKTEEGRVDSQNRLVKNIALTGTESKNGYRYSEAALQDGVPLYENKPVFLDHAASREQPHQRSARDLVGSIVHARYENGRIRGDIRVIDTEAGRTFLALAESNAPSVGMSHVILAEKNAEGTVIEKIHDVVSVDAVVFPATTKSFQEQQDPAGDLSATDIADLIRERDSLQAQVERLTREREELQNRQDVERLIDEAGLPAHAVSPVFRDQLLKAASPAERKTLIDERRALLESCTKTPNNPISRERLAEDLAGNKTLTDAQFIASVRQSTGF